MATKEELARMESTSLPKKEPAKPADKGEDAKQKAEQLLETLKGLKVETPEDLQGKLRAGQEVGQMANLLGDARKEIEALRAELQAAKAYVPRQSQQRQEYSIYDSYTGEDQRHSPPPAGLDEQTLERVILRVVDNTIIKPQRESHSAWLNEMNQIHGDQHFRTMPGLQEAWREIYNLPETQAKFQTGQVRPSEVFHDVKIKFLTSMLKQSSDVIENLTGKTVTSTGEKGSGTPTLESGTGQSTPIMPDDDDRKEKLRQIDKDRREGRIDSERAMHNIIDQFLPKGDPIWRP